MFLSVFDMFKVGIGPSSSHTVGPMVAMRQFLDRLMEGSGLGAVARVTVTLYGSLAFTGKGHGTDRALVLGLLGEIPSEIDPETVTVAVDKVIDSGRLQLDGTAEIPFSISEDILFEYGAPLDEHTNGLEAKAFDADGKELASETYFSVGGGVVRTNSRNILRTP